MIRRKGPILAAAVIAAFALGWYRGLFGIEESAPTPTPEAPKQAALEPAAPTLPSVAEQAPPTAAAPSTETPAVAPPAPVPPAVDSATPAASAPNASAPAPAAPGFDVVRVEPDGSTVVAGRGAANESIALTDGTRTFAEATTDANGDFVMSLSLPTGSHRLQLAQRDDAVSNDAAVVNVPARGQADQLLVMMERPGEASEVLQRPAGTAGTPPTVAEAPPSPSEPAAQQTAAIAAAQPEPVAPAQAAPDARVVDAGVSVEAVEIEGNKLFVAGSAKGRPTVRIYLDDAFVAEAPSGDGDRFIASATVNVPVGGHTIRADAVDASGRVVGRVEVPFQRPEGTAVAAVAPMPGAPTTSSPSPSAPAVVTAEVAPPQPQAPASTAPSPPAAPAPSPASSETASAPQVPVAPSPVAPSAEVATAAPSPAASSAPVAAGEPQAVIQAPLQAAASRVIIRRGDSLWRISRQTYGRGSRYTVIYLANGDQIRNPDRIYPGQVFRMPSRSEAEAPPRG